MPENSDPIVFSDANARFYLIESVQEILQVYGNNTVVEGMDVSIGLDKITISPGSVICDKTFIQFPDSLVFDIEFDNFEFEYLVGVVSFRYLRSSRPNPAIISIKSVDSNQYSENWFVERDKVALFAIDKELNVHRSTILEEKRLTINEIDYCLYPYNRTITQLRPILNQIKNISIPE